MVASKVDMPITSSDTCDPESTSQLFTDSSSRLTVNIETALFQDMEKATTEISEDTEKSFTEENPPYFDEDIPETSENIDCMITLSFIMKYHLSGQASSDLLTIFKLLGKNEHQMSDMSLKKIKKWLDRVMLISFISVKMFHNFQRCKSKKSSFSFKVL